MFSRKACHFFVRPKRKHLELVLFLGRAVKHPKIKKVVESSKTKRAHIIHVTHRDEVEAPLTDWMREAYELQDVLASPRKAAVKKKVATKAVKKAVTRRKK
jgi:hypothetical protein